MVKLRKRKGFTLTELAVVIAVIAVLIAVLVPTFYTLIKNAKESTDSQLVSYINEALSTSEVDNAPSKVELSSGAEVYNITEAITSLDEYGFGVSKLTAKADGADIVYNATTNRFIYYTEDFATLSYGTEPETDDVLVVITDSSLSRLSAVESSSSSIKNRGVNYCVYTEDSTVSITNSNTVTVWLYTVKDSTVTIDLANGTVYQNGVIETLTVEQVYSESLHVFGTINALNFKKGHLKYEASAQVTYLYVPSANVDSVKLTVDDNAVVLSDSADITISGYSGTVKKIDDVTYSSVDGYTTIFDEGTVTEEATCTEEGTITYTSIFGTTVTESIPATGHSYEFTEWATDYSYATFTCKNDSSHTKTVESTLVTYAPTSANLTEYSKYGISDSTHAINVYTVEFNGEPYETAITNEDWQYSGNTTLTAYSGSETAISIPEGTVTIQGGTSSSSIFGSNTKITSVVISDSVETIGAYAFYNCSGLTSITIGESVTTIENNAFDSCKYLTEIIYNAKNLSTTIDTLNAIFSNAGSSVYSTKGLTVTIGKEVTQIPANLFYPKSSSSFKSCVTSVIFEEGSVCTSIGKNAFRYCPLTSVNLPSSLTSIDTDAFYSCSSLMSVYYGGTISQWASITFSDEDANPLYNAGNLYINGTLLTDLKNTDITTISSYAFAGWNVTSISISNSVTSIGSYAFYKCESVTELSLGSNLKSIGKYAFYNCKITTVTIPASVTFIGTYAFRGTSLETAYFEVPDDGVEYCWSVGTTSLVLSYSADNGAQNNLGSATYAAGVLTAVSSSGSYAYSSDDWTRVVKE